MTEICGWLPIHMEFFGFIVMKKGAIPFHVILLRMESSTDVYADCLYTDAKGRIWVGTGGSGLNLYDEATDTFLPVHAKWNLPGDAVVSIRSDKEVSLSLETQCSDKKTCLL